MRFQKLISQGLVLGALFTLALPLSSSAQQIMTRDIVLDPYMGPHALSLPQLVIPPNDTLGIHLLNFSAQPLVFSSPDLNLSVTVPANSERVIYMDPAVVSSLQPGQTIAYSINDANGNVLASSTISNTQVAVIHDILQQTTTISEYQQTPSAGTTVQRSTTVRGYW